MKTIPKVRLAVIASGSGSNLQVILDACETPTLDMAKVVLVISNKPGAFALERAQKAKVETVFIDPKAFTTREEFYLKMSSELSARKVDLILLAGYMLKLESNIVQKFKGRILNIHPSLLPKFGGAGMYGHHVHEAVIKAGEKESGPTVHVVDEEFDHGPILKQRKVPVFPTDTAQVLAERVLKEEHLLYPEAVALYIKEYLRKD